MAAADLEPHAEAERREPRRRVLAAVRGQLNIANRERPSRYQRRRKSFSPRYIASNESAQKSTGW